MRKIPDKLKQEILADPFYKKCCITGETKEKIEWHHNLIYAGKQVNEKWCILPLAKSVHDKISRYKEHCDWIMLNRATDAQLLKYSKSTNYIKLRRQLNEKFS